MSDKTKTAEDYLADAAPELLRELQTAVEELKLQHAIILELARIANHDLRQDCLDGFGPRMEFYENLIARAKGTLVTVSVPTTVHVPAAHGVSYSIEGKTW